jgi:hypothetical protein
MIDRKRLLTDLQGQQRKLEKDLREQIALLPNLSERLGADYAAARAAGRTAETFSEWSEGEITQGAVAWLLACVFLRFVEDNQLIAAPLLAGPGARNGQAREAMRAYFSEHPAENERHYLQHAFRTLGGLRALAGLFDEAHNPLFRLPLSYETAKALVEFWQRVDPDTGALVHDFSDAELNTRFLGDLYQDLSEAARKRYALLQTPEFVEEFILDRTLDPALRTFGLKGLRLIDPTCGSGHFLLGAFARLLRAWEVQAPGMDVLERIQNALDSVYGVDLNPFAVAITRFRLLVAALKATGSPQLKNARDWRFNVTTGDSLLHGQRFGELGLGCDQLDQRYAHVYASEDRAEIERILGQQYHAVVGNPPYITASDAALNLLYRDRYSTCHRKFSLGVPFTERFFQLAIGGSEQPEGYIGLITTNSFMTREFGTKLVRDYLPSQDLTHVIDTSGCYVPGHGTPTVIMFGRHRPAVSAFLRAVLGIRGEPGTPDDPSEGKVWTSIVRLIDSPGRSNEFIGVSDLPRTTIAKHPWSLQGGVAPAVLEAIEGKERRRIANLNTEIGFGAILGEDDAFILSCGAADQRRRIGAVVIPLVIGDDVRDWAVRPSCEVVFPYSPDIDLVDESNLGNALWHLRTALGSRNDFGGQTYRESGRPYWSYHQIPVARNRIPLSIGFAFVSTHGHFVLDRGGKVFNRTAPVIKLPPGASVDVHLGLLGLLNSSTACFWLKQLCFNKGSTVDSQGARQTTVEFENFYEFTGTKLAQFPLPSDHPISIAAHLDSLARRRAATLPAALSARLPLTRSELDQSHADAELLMQQMIAAQEELDWWCYRAYGLIDKDLIHAMPSPIALGERAFEIVLARKVAAGEIETTWFARHGSTPITALPAHWPADYRAVVERRIALIETHPWIGLLERPEYKRRWNQPTWADLEASALKAWLLDRLERPGYWPEPSLQRLEDIAAHTERDADFMAVAQLYRGQVDFDVHTLLVELLQAESVSALAALRYTDSGLRKRADWESTWDQQRAEDAIDAAVERGHPAHEGESPAEWQTRIAPEQKQRKRDQIGELPAPPKYTSADFQNTTLWRLRGALDVPKERWLRVPDPLNAGHWLYGWAGWNPAQRVQAIAGTIIDAETRHGVPVPALIPLYAAIAEELPWVKQWHNTIDPDYGIGMGDYFDQWLRGELQRHGLTREHLKDWQPERAGGRGRRKSKA